VFGVLVAPVAQTSTAGECRISKGLLSESPAQKIVLDEPVLRLNLILMHHSFSWPS